MNLNEFRTYFSGTSDKEFTKGPGFIGECPACGSTSKHLSVSEYDDWLHVHCVRGHTETEILDAIGLGTEDRRVEIDPLRPERPTEIIYDNYRTLDGKQIFIKKRFYQWKDNEWKKSFVIQTLDGKSVKALGDERFMPYAMHVNAPKIATGRRLWLHEGEKAAEMWLAMGEAATCQSLGANVGGLSNFAINQLRGVRDFAIIADRDEPGESYAKKVAEQMTAPGRKLMVYSPAVKAAKADGYDHILAGYTFSDLVPRPDLMPPRGINVKEFDDTFQPVSTEFLIEPWLPVGKAILFDAKGGVGKSSLMLNWAAALSRGVDPLTGLELACGPVKTLYLHKGEDTEEELQTVYMGNGGRIGFIGFAGEDFMFNTAGLNRVEETISDFGYRLVIVDPLYSFMVGVVNNPNDALSVLPVVGEITRIAARTGATFVDIRHMRKGATQSSEKESVDVTEMGMGSVTFKNTHRGQLIATYVDGYPGLIKVIDGRGSIMRKASTEPFHYRRVGLEVKYIVSH